MTFMVFTGMPLLTTRLQQRGNKRMFYLKVTLPKDLQPRYKAAYGKSSEMVRLFTDSPREAQARQARALAQVQERVAAILDVAPMTSGDRLADIVSVIDQWRRHDQERDAADQLQVMKGGSQAWADRHLRLRDLEDHLSGTRQPDFLEVDAFGARPEEPGEHHRYFVEHNGANAKYPIRFEREFLLSLVREDWRVRIDNMAARSGVPKDWRHIYPTPKVKAPHGGTPTEADYALFECGVSLNHPNYAALYDIIRREWLERTRARLAAFHSAPLAMQQPSPEPASMPAPRIDPPAMDLTGLMPDALKPLSQHIVAFMATKVIADSSVSGYHKSLSRLIAHCGNKPVCAYSTLDIEHFYQQVSAERSEKKDDGDRLNYWTVYRIVSNVRQFFKWAYARHLVRDDPTRKLMIEKRRVDDDDDDDDDGYEPYTADELRRIFGSPEFVALTDDERWLALVALHSGMRFGEARQLETTDIVEHNGRKHFSVSKVSEFGFKKRLKTSSAIRLIPVHPALIDGGFLEFVGKKNGRIYASIDRARYWNEELTRDLGVWVRRTKVFHSLRGNFRDALKQAARGDTEAIDRYMGHAARGTGQQYYGQRNLLPHESQYIDRVSLPCPWLEAQQTRS